MSEATSDAIRKALDGADVRPGPASPLDVALLAGLLMRAVEKAETMEGNFVDSLKLLTPTIQKQAEALRSISGMLEASTHPDALAERLVAAEEARAAHAVEEAKKGAAIERRIVERKLSEAVAKSEAEVAEAEGIVERMERGEVPARDRLLARGGLDAARRLLSEARAALDSHRKVGQR